MARMELSTDMTTSGARILMVDDDPGIRDVVSDFLGTRGRWSRRWSAGRST
jgi:two-component system OmpR family response regulator